MNDFPKATLEMWRKRVGDPEKLVSFTSDGLRIEPLYQQLKDDPAVQAQGKISVNDLILKAVEVSTAATMWQLGYAI